MDLVNTYINIEFENLGTHYTLSYSFWSFQQETFHHDKKVFKNEPHTLRYNLLQLMNEALAITDQQNIDRVVLVVNTNTLKAFLTNIVKKGVKKLDLSLKEEAEKLLYYRKKYRFLGYRYEKTKKVIPTPKEAKEREHAKLLTPTFYEYTSYTDVSTRKGKSMIAGIIYNKKGKKIHEFKKKLEENTNTTYLEGAALYESMVIAKRLNLKKVLFRTDNRDILTIYKTQVEKEQKDIKFSKKKAHHKMIYLITQKLQDNEGWQLEKINRKHNKYAHQLARKI